MVRPPNELGSLRFSRLEKERLLLALVFSLLAHLAVWGGYEADFALVAVRGLSGLSALCAQQPDGVRLSGGQHGAAQSRAGAG